MGSDWWWTLALPGGTLTPATAERLLALAGAAGLSPHRPGGGINGFDNSPGVTTRPGAHGWDSVTLSLDSVHCRREPDARADPFRELHRRLTELWVAIADETGALFGRVEDEWSLEQIWSELPDPTRGATPPAPGSWPDWLSWSTYFGAERHRQPAPLPAELGAGVRRTRRGAAVIELLTDPAAVDPVRFARLFHEYRRAVGVGLPS